MSRAWRDTSDRSEAWRECCRSLWITKQNHPLDRWITLPPDHHEENESYYTQYQSELDNIEILLLYMLSPDQLPSPNDVTTMKYSSYLDALSLARRINQPREAAPLSHYIRERQIQKEREYFTLSEEEGMEVEMEKMRIDILNNLQQSMSSEWFQDRYRAYEGSDLVLSWRESFIASMVDSKRCRITYEELRLQGDWLTHWNFSESAGISRVIRGGFGMINDRTFSLRPAPIHLGRYQMLVYTPMGTSPHPWRFHFIRFKDWGWMGICGEGSTDVCLRSFDRYTLSSTDGEAAVFHHNRGSDAVVRPLTTPLKDDPMNQLYKL